MFRAWTSQALAAVVATVLAVAGDARAQMVTPQEQGQSSEEEGKAAPAKKASPADVQGSLDQASKLLDAGKADQAVQKINSLLAGARLQGQSMARALHLRGAAYHKLGKPAQAIADLTSALWLKGGLSDADRAAVTALRAQAYRDAGLTELAEADVKKAGRSPAAGASIGAFETTAKSGGARDAGSQSVASAPQQSSGGGVSNFFSNLFGGNTQASQASTEAKPARSEAAPSTPSKQPSVGEAWSTSVDAKPVAVTRVPASVKQETAALPARDEPAIKAAAAPPKVQGRYRLQVAAVRGRADALAVASRLKKDYATALGGREPEVDETVIGNMGTFYRVRLGPFADATEPGALCAKLRGVGLDCLIITE